jgi:hypothetical protein
MSEPNRQRGSAGAANGQLAQHADQDPDAAIHLAPAPDPWFDPSPRQAGQADGGIAVAAAADSHQAEWFLPTGRAALLPESMTESWEETGHPADRPEVAAKPPWAGEQAAAGSEAPPPWETGPWPGPGEAMPKAEPAPAGAGERSVAAQIQAPAQPGNWQARAALATGILPLVVPGAVLGVLGLRRASVTGTGRMWSWLGIGLSVVWAVILIVQLTGGGGSSGRACGGYQSDVSRPVSVVLRDLASGAPQRVLDQDLEQAISKANSAAADEPVVAARDVMVTLTTGLQQALTAATADHSTSSYALIHSQLGADVAAVTAACTG